MKYLSIGLIALVISINFANARCFDIMSVNFEACPMGQQMFLYKGACVDANFYQDAFCSEPLNCVNKNDVNFPPCYSGTKRVYIQGACQGENEIEASACLFGI